MTFGNAHEPALLAVSATRCHEAHDDGGDCGYDVRWNINPHMQAGSAAPERAARQHARFRRALETAGARLLELPFVHGAFDSVFTKDCALLARHGERTCALPASFASRERQAEEDARQRALEARGFTVMEPPLVPFEGGDIVRVPGGLTLMGYGPRTARQAASRVSSFLREEVLPLELVDPWLYHLDTAVAALEDGSVLVCPDALSPPSLRALARHPRAQRLHFIPREEALRFALNLVQLGEVVVTGARATPETDRRLVEAGLRIVRVELSEFQLAGGSAACLVARAHHPLRVATSETTEILSTSW